MTDPSAAGRAPRLGRLDQVVMACLHGACNSGPSGDRFGYRACVAPKCSCAPRRLRAVMAVIDALGEAGVEASDVAAHFVLGDVGQDIMDLVCKTPRAP